MTNTTSMKKTRRFDIDWLRIFATYLLFIFHVSKVFDVPPFYQIKNNDLSEGLNLFTGFVHQWHMPLFFLLAGWSVYASLKKRGTANFLKERMLRIFLPFVMGCIIICPPMQYIYAKTSLSFDESFLEFLPLFFTSLRYFSWSHLWFLIYLFTFTLLYLPLFNWLIKRDFSIRVKKRIFVFIPVVLFIIVQVSLRERWPGFQNLYDDWGNFSYYSMFFILGFIFSSSPSYEELMHRQWIPSLFIGLSASVIMGFPFLWQWPKAGWGMSAVAGYFLVISLLGMGRIFLSKTIACLSYLTQSAYPVYILHQFFIVVPAYFIVQLSLSIVFKFILLLIIAVSLTMLMYHFIVLRFSVVKFLFGLKEVHQ